MSKFKKDFQAGYQRGKAQAHRRGWGGFKFWLSIITFILIIVVLWAAREELVQAFHLMSKVNIWLLLLIIPVQFGSYYASTEIFFTYLRARGQLKKLTPLKNSGIALEFNFVNHVFPSAGVSGASYMVWRLGKLGVPAGQAAMSQLINYVSLGGTFMVMMAVALIWATVEDRAANWIVMATTVAIVGLIGIIIFGSYLISSRERLMSFAAWLTRRTNWLVNKITFGRRREVLQAKMVNDFFSDFYDDFQAIRDNKALLKGPIIWGFISNVLDVLLFAVAFWALGYPVNLAILLISFGASALGSFLVVTPGGVGAYEAVMIGVLVAGGLEADVASAGVILARVILVLGTIICGVFAYNWALRKYGRPDFKTAAELDEQMDQLRAERNQERHARQAASHVDKPTEAKSVRKVKHD